MSSFLVQYNRRTGDVEVQEFNGESGRRQALAQRVQAEISRSSADVEIAVLSADSIEELRRTHGRYFNSATDILRHFTDRDTPLAV